MNKITFELTWNDIHAALTNYVKDKADLALDIKPEDITQSYVSFTENDGNPKAVENASVIVKLLNR